MSKQVHALAASGRPMRKPRAATVAALVLGAALLAPFGLVATAAPASAATGQKFPLNNNKPVAIDTGSLYASSGGSIIKINVKTGAQEEIASRSAAVPTYYWASNLGLGPDPQDNSKMAFQGSAYNSNRPEVFKATEGSTNVEEIGQARQSSGNRTGGTAWGGGAVDTQGRYWQGTNLLGTTSTKISMFDSKTNTTVVSGRLVAPAGDRVWAGGGYVAPDYAFDVQGNFYGLVQYYSETYIYQFDVSNFAEGAEVPVQQVLKITGLGAGAGSQYGFAWLDGKWYTGQSNGRIFSIDPNTGVASNTGITKIAGTNNGSYRLEDLASGGVVPINPAGDAEVKKTSDVPLRIAMVSNQVLNYTLTYTNNTQRPAIVDEFDDMSRVLDDSTVNSQPVSDNAALQVSAVSGNQFTIKGTLAAGQTVTIKYSVKVNQPSNRGDNRMTNFVLKTGETAPQFCIASNSRCADNRTATSITG